MFRVPVLCLTLSWALAATAETARLPGSEQLQFVEPKGWQEVYTDRDGNLSTTEYAPPGQTADDWRELISVQILLDTPDADPDLLLSRAAQHLGRSCTAFEVQPIELGGVGEYPTLAFMLMCGRNTDSGQGEFTLMRGIAGHENFYILQKVWRVPPYALDAPPPVSLEERKAWMGFLAYLRVCDLAAGTCAEKPE